MMENYHLKQCLSGVIFVILALISDNGVRTDVNFKSKPTTIKTFENDSVLLPCYSTEPHSAVRWIGSDDKLIADSRQPSYRVPNRVLNSNGSLEVTNIKLDDTGDYICEITIGGRQVITQLHSLEVQVEPEVITYPSGEMNVTLGAFFQITCEPKGVPYPILSWYHNNVHVTNTYDGNRRLNVEVKHYDMAGRIECRATNWVGKEPKSAGIILIVNFAPEIKVGVPVVHTRPGMQAKIECLVYSHPTATVHWFVNGMPVNKRNNVITTQDVDLSVSEPSLYYSKKRHVLMIRNVREADFGKYECKAENPLGMQSGFVTLMGNPLKPVFENKNSATTSTCKTLSWQTESQSPIIDYKFKFREVPSGNENFRKSASFMWNQLTIPSDKSPGPFHTKSYKLDGLKPIAVYEVMIQARNQFGLSEDSNIFRFGTPSKVDIINTSSTDTNEYDVPYDEDLMESNDIYPSYYNAGRQLTRTRISFLFAVVTVLLL